MKSTSRLICISLLFFLMLRCDNDNREVDWREKYTGEYLFNINVKSSSLCEIEPNNWIFVDDSSSYQYLGRIERHLNNRLLIKYSHKSPWKICRVCSEDNCWKELIDFCPDSLLHYTRYWINPVIELDGTLKLDYDERNHAEGFFIGNDSVKFILEFFEKTYHYSDNIVGVKIN